MERKKGIRTRDPHLGKVVDLVCEFPASPLDCCSVHPVSTLVHSIRPCSRAVYYRQIAPAMGVPERTFCRHCRALTARFSSPTPRSGCRVAEWRVAILTLRSPQSGGTPSLTFPKPLQASVERRYSPALSGTRVLSASRVGQR